MREKKLPLKIQHDFPIPINVQVKEQIKWLIGAGKLKPGEYLPPTNQLAEHLQLNRNTVNWVYNQLRDEGLLTLQKGKGTRVQEGAKVEEWITTREPLLSYIQSMTKEVVEHGFHLEDILIPSYAYYQLSHLYSDHPRLKVLLIEGRGQESTFLKSEIEQLTQAEVEVISTEELRDQPDIEESVDFIVTTWDHQEEVEGILTSSEKKFLTIATTIQSSTLIDIAKLKTESKVAFIGHGKLGGHWMAQRIEEAGITHIQSMPQGADSLDQLFTAIEIADFIYTSPTIFERIKKLAPDKTNMFVLQLERGSETLLKELGNRKVKI